MATFPNGTRRTARPSRLALPLAGALLVACGGTAVVEAGDGDERGVSTLETGDARVDGGGAIGAVAIADTGEAGDAGRAGDAADAPGESSVTRSATGSTIIVESSLLCLEAAASGAVVQTACDEGDAQRFELVATGNVYVVHTSLGTCLDHGPTPGSAAPVFATTCLAGSSNQSWTVIANDDGSYTFASASGTGCLGPEDASLADLAALITWTCESGAPSERMYLAELASRSRLTRQTDGGPN